MANVVIVGGGNAALCAAISGRLAGADVLMLERAQAWDRGGNSKHTRNIRCVRDRGSAEGEYSPDELIADLRGVTGDGLDLKFARIVVDGSRGVPAWMEAQGVRWQSALRGTLQLARTNRFFLGGGKALVNTYYERARVLGVTVSYGTTVEGLRFDDRRVRAVIVSDPDTHEREIACDAVVVASGGFEANLEWLRRYWGDAVDNYFIRGTPHNDGRVLAALLDAGVPQKGNPKGFHAVAIDARAPRFDGGIVTRVDSIPFGVVVNRDGDRFYDEGEEIWPKRYATWGGLIARQPEQIAYSLFDQKARGRFIPAMYPPFEAGNFSDLAALISVPADRLRRTIDEYNDAATDATEYDASKLDGRATRGLALPKSNWALRLDAPPYYAYPLRPGITFTYLGVAVDDRARVIGSDGAAFTNLFAAGEVMAGNILQHGYLAGFGMTIGSVFGRIAGEEAARVVRS